MPDRKYLSLQEATKHMPFDSNYLGLLIRKGRIFGVKKKGRWYTTKEAIDEYMEKSARVKIPEKKSWVNLLLSQIGIGSVFFMALLLFAVVSNAFFFEEGKENISQSLSEQTVPTDGTPAIVGEGREVSSLVARR